MTYAQIEVRPVTGALGAEVSGVDLAQALVDGTREEIRAAWLEYQVLFFHDQELTPHQHEAFAG